MKFFTIFSKLSFLLPLYSFLLLVYSIFSYSLTDPNLVLTTWEPYWHFQQWMWQTFFNNHQLLAITYTVLLGVLFLVYWRICVALQKSSLEYQRTTNEYILIFLLLILPLLFSYNALSHDVFNYIFNAKMVAVYHTNPHIHVALDFPQDTWTRFMHNTHTPAPYGYGWTGISLVPYFVGVGKFITTWLAFRLWSIVSIILLFLTIQYGARVFRIQNLQSYQLAFLFLNPLFLLEVVSNMHNDLWMIVPAMLSVILLASLSLENVFNKKRIFLLVLFFIVSVSIKYATLVLLPLVLLIGLEKRLLVKVVSYLKQKLPILKSMPAHMLENIEAKYYQFIPFIASLLLFLPLLTDRSQQFHPWYLLWSLAWIPLSTVKWWKQLLCIFSVTSMLRYVPWLIAGEFTDTVIFQQIIITWSALLLWGVWHFVLSKKTKSKIIKVMIPRKDSNLK